MARSDGLDAHEPLAGELRLPHRPHAARLRRQRLIALCIAWLTVGGTAAKAASARPVLTLRYE